MPQAKDLALRSLAMDEHSAEAHHALAAGLFWYEWDWSGAERAFRRAIKLNPGLSAAHINLSSFLDQMGRPDEALAHAQRAIQLDPLDLNVHRLLVDHFTTIRQFDVAGDRGRKTLDLEPTYIPAYWTLVQAGSATTRIIRLSRRQTTS